MKNAWIAITCLAFAACGGGGSGDGPTTVESSITFVPPAGVLEYEVTLATKSTFRAAACDSQGRYLLAGKNAGMGFLARYLTTGELDASFGWVFLSQVVEWRSLAIQSDGTIVALGTASDGKAVVARYDSTGSLQSTTLLSFFGQFFFGAAMAVDPATDRIVVAGFTQPFPNGGELDAAVALVTKQGYAEPEFGSPKVPGLWSLSLAGDDAFEAVAWSEGMIVAGGAKTINEEKRALLALLPGGAEEWSLKVDKTEGLETKITDLAIADGAILAGVATKDEFGGIKCGVWRYDSEGLLDPQFVKSYVKDAEGSGDAKVALQPDGNILVTAGNKVARVLKGGGLDKTFIVGKAEHLFFDVVLTPANKILGLGIENQDGSKAWFAQYR